jgi:hypothetical protein
VLAVIVCGEEEGAITGTTVVLGGRNKGMVLNCELFLKVDKEKLGQTEDLPVPVALCCIMIQQEQEEHCLRVFVMMTPMFGATSCSRQLTRSGFALSP